MLAQNFKTASELGLTDAHVKALQKTLVLLETGKLVHVPSFDVHYIGSKNFTGHFNMRAWAADSNCGTVRCIGGTAEIIGDVSFEGWADERTPLFYLFSPPGLNNSWDKITDAEAATALRSYLTTGDARWDLALSRSPQEIRDV